MVKTHLSAGESVAGRYRPLEVVHRETNRVVWYAEDIDTRRPRLLTQIRLPEGSGRNTTQRTTTHVVRTHEIMGVLRPGRVATVVDTVEENGTLWTVTEWVDGIPLGELLAQRGAFGPGRAARIGLEVLDVLDAAHGEGITHGELSPGQIFVRDQGPVVVTGFGLVGATLVPRVTAPSYASPEQARDERIGPAADLWALGAILYTMTEGRPPFRDRGRPEATLRGVDRLPLRAPLRAGPLTQTVQGLLRKDSRERLTRPVVREALARVATDEAGTDRAPAAGRRWRGAHSARRWGSRAMVAGTALAVVTVAVAMLAATDRLPGAGSSSASGTATRPPASGTGPGSAGRITSPSAPTPTATRSPSASASPTATAAAALPTGYRNYTAPEGFSVALPDSWTRLKTSRVSDLAYRVTFGASGDPRTLAVTYSTRLGPDPVAVWRDDVQPGLEQLDGFQRIGDIRATTYQGYTAADMEWYAGTGSDRVRTFGRGFLLGDGRGFSLRWTTPADDWDDPANRLALRTFLKTFRPG